MGKQACTFRQTDLTRAVRGAVAGGIKVSRVEIDKTTGNIILVAENGDRQRIDGSPEENDFGEPS